MRLRGRLMAKAGRPSGPWLAVGGEVEALSSLGNYAYEHPADVFPEFVDTSPCFEAEGLGHPLFADRAVVRNDLRLGSDLRVLIVSGPNMAGKSTFIRSVGINAVLAQCGAPARARRLRLSPSRWGHRFAFSIRFRAVFRGFTRRSAD